MPLRGKAETVYKCKIIIIQWHTDTDQLRDRDTAVLQYHLKHFFIGQAVLCLEDLIDLIHDLRIGVKHIETCSAQRAVGDQADCGTDDACLCPAIHLRDTSSGQQCQYDGDTAENKRRIDCHGDKSSQGKNPRDHRRCGQPIARNTRRIPAGIRRLVGIAIAIGIIIVWIVIVHGTPFCSTVVYDRDWNTNFL